MQHSAMKHRFRQRLGQTSENPMMFSASKAKGIYIYDEHGNPFIDLVSGVSVCNLGHQHPEIVQAVKEQIDKHMHLMVYGEFVQPVQIELADLLVKQLHSSLNAVYFVNSGSEAIEGAMKLAKRYTGKNHIVACKNGYHGSSQGALSLLGNESFKRNYRPLLPGIDFIRFNNTSDFDKITTQTAAVVIEPIQAEAGICIPDDDYLAALKQRCRDVGALLIFDEVQTGLGRTGKLFAYMHYNVIPDIMCVAKAFGGGMPLGAFIADKHIMDVFTKNPMLGHITTFGGHPVSCAAALANLKVLLRDKLIEQVDAKASLYFDLLIHPRIKKVWGKGLFIGIEMETEEEAARVMEIGAKTGGFITDLFLFKPNAFRIGAPLIITEKQIRESVKLILNTLDTDC
ncbi:MAG: aspartate aminotransferase family protein [Bacteroidota bacterium]|nr:aspartate aminotransferase family protein [Bacteroidota bacterium]